MHPAYRTRGDRRPSHGFTLVELMVSMVVLAVLVVVLASIVSRTSSMWTHTVSKVEQFRNAREAFESLTRRLSQATLNTYWDYDNPNAPTTYLRQSDLRFVSGPGVAGSPATRPTHGVFFFAPLGFVAPTGVNDTAARRYEGLDELLNAWGYFIEYGDDSASKPSFVDSPPRSRFRLMEFMQPSHALSLHGLQRKAGGNTGYTGRDWFLDAIKDPEADRPVHVLAENIVALVVLPKLAAEAQKAGSYSPGSLAPGYLYDSTGTAMTTLADPNLNPKNQLPPIVQVTMVAIDEASAARMSPADVDQLKAKLAALFTNPDDFETDLGNASPPPSGSLAHFLASKRIGYRIFTTEISIKAAKWSTQQKN